MTSAESTAFDSLWNYNDPESTEKKFRELLPEVKASGNESHLVQLLTQIARTYSLRRMFDEAHKLLDETKNMLNDSMPRAKVRYFLERGRTYNSSGDLANARQHFLDAYNLALSSGEDNLAVDAAHMMGIVERGDSSVQWNETALKLAESSEDEEAGKWLGSLYNNLGWTYFDMKNYNRALELFEKDIEWYEARERTTNANIARWSAAKTKRMMGKVEDAYSVQLMLKEVIERTADEDGYVYEELAECCLLLGHEDDAKKYAATAYKILSKDSWLIANERERVDRLKKIGEVED